MLFIVKCHIMSKQQLYMLYYVWPYDCQSDYCIEYYVSNIVIYNLDVIG